MKLLRILSLLCVLSLPALAQQVVILGQGSSCAPNTTCLLTTNNTWAGINQFSQGVIPGQLTVAQMLAIPTPTLTTLVGIIDGASNTDCSVGGGSTPVVCMYSGSSTWIPFGSGGSGGVSNCTTPGAIAVYLSSGTVVNCNTGVTAAPGTENSFSLGDNASITNAGAGQMKLGSLNGVPSIGFNGPLSQILTASLFNVANGVAGLDSSAVVPIAQEVTSTTNCDGSHAILGNRTCGSIGSTSIQTNGTNNSSQTTLNHIDAAAFHGLTLTWSNPSGGNEQPVLGGSLDLATQTHPSVTVNGTTCTLGSSCSPSGSSGSTLLNSQGPQTAVTGTGAAANLYTFTIPGGTMSTTSCIYIYAGFQHTTGSASVTYTWNFGSASSSSSGSNGTGNGRTVMRICNNGATNSQFIDAFDNSVIGTTIFNSVNRLTAAIDTTTNQTVSLQFNVANTDAVTPKFWMVESVH